MDPLSSSITDILNVAGKIVSISYSYGESVVECSQEIRDWVAELSSLMGILQTLKVLTEMVPSGVNSQLTSMGFLQGPLSDCAQNLEGILETLIKNQASGNKLQKLGKRIMWPLKGKETQVWIQRIERYKSTFELALLADNMNAIRSISADVDTIRKNQQKEKEEKVTAEKSEKVKKVSKWLSVVDPQLDHRAARKLQQAGTGEWFTGGNTFNGWLHRDHSVLWLHGTPGAGKTILSSLIIDRINAKLGHKDIPVAYFYCDFRDADKQSAVNLLGSLISQILEHQTDIPAGIETLYERSNGNLPSFESLQEEFYTLLAELPRTIVVIDALDECKDKNDLMEFLRELNDPAKGNINLLVTSRNELDIKLAFSDLLSLSIDPDDVAKDIKMYVSHEIERQPKLKRLKPTTKKEIIDTLVSEAHGMFRWAKCILDQISKLRNDKAIKTALQSLPPDLGETYERILCNIQEEDKEMAARVLRWLVVSSRPLTLEEIVEAIAVEIGDISLDPDVKLNEPDDILDICGGLASINEETGHVGLAHFSVKEYLISKRIANSRASSFHVRLDDANFELSKICVTYLSFEEFSGSLPSPEEQQIRLQKYPLLQYAAKFWGLHAHGHEDASDQQFLDVVGTFFTPVSSDNFSYALYVSEPVLPDPKNDVPSYPSQPKYFKLHEGQHAKNKLLFAALFGILSVVRVLVLDGADINATCSDNPQNYCRDYCGNALQAACANGNEKVVEFLLDSEADFNVRGGYFGSSLSAAAAKGYVKIVKLLLERGANVNIGGGKYGFPLHAAAAEGHEDIVQILVQHGADIQIRGGEWGFPLQAACSHGDKTGHRDLAACSHRYTRIVRFLIEKGADVNTRGGGGGLPLHVAAEKGNRDMVQMLLDKGANVRCIGGLSGSAIGRAATSEKEDVFELLLDHGAGMFYTESLEYDSDPPCNKHNGCALVHASYANFTRCAKRIVEKEIDLIIGDTLPYYLGAVHAAVGRGNAEILNILLPYGDRGGFGTSQIHDALKTACYSEHASTVKLYLEVLTNTNTLPKSVLARTLLLASAKGNVQIVEQLLDAGADPNEPDENGWTPTLCAARYQKSDVLQKLLVSGGRIGLDVEMATKRPDSLEVDLRELPNSTLEINNNKLEAKQQLDNYSWPVVVRANRPIPYSECGYYYFEVEVLDRGREDGYIAVGLWDALTKHHALSEVRHDPPGVSHRSVGFYGVGGLKMKTLNVEDFGPPYGSGDVVGCVFKWQEGIAYFTLNGSPIVLALYGFKGLIAPGVALSGPGTHVRINFGDRPFVHNVQDIPTSNLELKYDFDRCTEPYELFGWTLH